jgi:RNA polymerase sigma-70 factor (ECF subfamily)
VTSSLSAAFLEAARPELASAFADPADLEGRLQALVDAARGTWPAIDVSPRAFVAHLAARAADASSLEPSQGAVDLYLACACLEGGAPAVSEVERRVREQARRAARRLRVGPSDAEELAQQMLASVLVGEGGSPGIARYSGMGALDAWLAATAVRMGLRTRERARRESPDGDAGEVAGAWEQDPELDFIKRRYRDHFNAAFREALGSLSVREKSVLRLYLFGGLNIEQIGVCYRVHRATVARWIVAARQKLLDETRAALARALGLESSDVDSIVGLLQSQIDVSLTDYLAVSQE